MKKILLTATVVASTLTFSSCGTQNQALGNSLLQGAMGALIGGNNNGTTQVAAQAGTAVLGGLLNQLLAGGSVSQQNLVGTWSYTGPSTVFESENFLAQAGGAIAATQVESKLDEQLTKLGFKKGSTTFTFKADNTFSATLGGKRIEGTYQYDPQTKAIRLSAVGGLLNFNATVVSQAGGIALLFEADKLLSLLNTTTSILGKSSSQLGLVSNLLGNFNGLRLGLKMVRQ